MTDSQHSLPYLLMHPLPLPLPHHPHPHSLLHPPLHRVGEATGRDRTLRKYSGVHPRIKRKQKGSRGRLSKPVEAALDGEEAEGSKSE